ncbi:MAG: cyclic diguanylate phosphodiesterase [bacterium]|nr:cyclic diguanylate phosphodiesterase [bacterium]
MTKRHAIQFSLILLITVSFITITHLIYANIILAWNKLQLEDLAARMVLRTELATDLAVNTIIGIQTAGQTTCTADTIAAFKSYVMSVGALKDIRMRSAGTKCAVFSSDHLQTDLDAIDSWESSLNSTIQLAVLTTDKERTLSVLWRGSDHEIVAVISTGGLLFDMIPSGLRSDLSTQVTLNSGKKLATYLLENKHEGGQSTTSDDLRFTAYSKRYPIKAQLRIDKNAIGDWNKKYTSLIGLLVGMIGLFLGLLTARALFPPLGAIDEIDTAITNGEFVPYFQPIIDLKSSQISGFEMLARWIKPDGEIISPGRFIPLAENFDRVDAILFSLLHSAGLSLASELRTNSDLKLTFNLTPAQFLDPTFLPRLLKVINLAGLSPQCLVAEITERQEIADLELASQTIAQYHKHGLRIAIDDAGTGHNGLSSIQTLDVGTLKLDKIFIDGIVDNQRSQQMIELLVNLARQYHMTIVAEGIEQPEQAVAALSMGISEGQGFYFSKPIPAKDLLSLLNEQRQPLIQNNTPSMRKKSTRDLSIAS